MGSQLRSFSAYDKTAGQSLFTVACRLVNIDGNYQAGPGGEFFQIFDKASVPVANDVPLRSFYLPAGPVNLPSIFQTLGPLTLTLGLAVGISSVNEKYTASASAYDVFGDVEEYEMPVSGLTTVNGGDTVTDVLVWTDATGPKHLYSLTVVNNEGITVYPQIYPSDSSPVVGTKPVLNLGPLAQGATRTYNFGSSGYVPSLFSNITFDACHVVLSDTGGSFGEAAIVGAAGTSIVAKYKTL